MMSFGIEVALAHLQLAQIRNSLIQSRLDVAAKIRPQRLSIYSPAKYKGYREYLKASSAIACCGARIFELLDINLRGERQLPSKSNEIEGCSCLTLEARSGSIIAVFLHQK